MKLIVVAGGQGTKLWPYSTSSKPKQFQKIIGDETLFRYQIKTLLKSYSPSDIFISTKMMYVKYVVEDAPEIPLQNIFIEPDFAKNRGPGEGYAVLRLSMIHPDEPFMIVQSDCLRHPEEKYLSMLSEAEKLAKKYKKFITGGQKALFADMGSDYLQVSDQVEGFNVDIFKINKFVERLGDYQKTKELIRKFNVVTHTNHCCWYPELMLNAYEKYRPDWYESLMKIKKSFGKTKEKDITNEVYSKMEAGMTEEVTKHIMPDGFAILVPYKWTDVGTWGSVYEYFSTNGGSNYIDGDVVDVNTESSLIKGKKGKVIAVLGVKDLVVVDTDDALLITTKEKSGNIKLILEELAKKGLKKYL